MKQKEFDQKFENLLFTMINQELKKGVLRHWIDGDGFNQTNPDPNDEFEGSLVFVDDEEIQIYPALYKPIMKIFGLSITQIIILLEKWAVSELPKNMPFSKKYFKKNMPKWVNVHY